MARTEADAERALRSANAALSQIRKVKTSAAVGNVRDLVKALESGIARMEEARAETERIAAGWQFDDRAYLESGDFVRELQNVAQSRNLTIIEQDGRLLTYPSVIRVLAADAAVEIDRKRERRIRPSVLVDRLRAAQEKPPVLKAEAFLETLKKAHDLLLALKEKEPGAEIRLLDVYAVLTLMPGRGLEYSRQEFARDLYLLDRSDVQQTRDGWNLRFSAATGTKGSGTLATVTPDGELKVYYAIAFER
ncbi:MAG: hypothetical protein ACREMQ_21775 [Longimicrobiales bacterium]